MMQACTTKGAISLSDRPISIADLLSGVTIIRSCAPVCIS
jgi:hypothetical protein